ncbi:hypothetical protein BS78_03G414000 [Paspalum vaginatum]|nr:hypothetical protein BS78_03G414000 [Paspalum vaginatum]
MIDHPHPRACKQKKGQQALHFVLLLRSCTFSSHTPRSNHMEEKQRRSGDGGFTVLGLLGAVALAFLLPKPAGAGAAADKWQWHADHAASPSPLSAPPPTAGADLPPPTHSPSPPGSGKQQTAPHPHCGFPLQPPTLGSGPASAPPPDGGDGYPFIGSNPTAPLPTGMTDTATVLPLPDNTKVVGLAAAPARAHVSSSIIGPLLFFAIVYCLSTTTWA